MLSISKAERILLVAVSTALRKSIVAFSGMQLFKSLEELLQVISSRSSRIKNRSSIAKLTSSPQLDPPAVSLVLIGLFAIFSLLWGLEIDSLFITAVLTVIGFSVHDTIVVFDRIRENSKYLSKNKTFSEISNDSINQTLVRSINTSITVLITLGTLYLLGGETTKTFVGAMFLGIASGTYSSIFVASALLVWWRELAKKRKHKAA